MIITYDDEGEIVRDGLKIEIKPAWKWVVNGEWAIFHDEKVAYRHLVIW